MSNETDENTSLFETVIHNFDQLLIAIDQFCNVILCILVNEISWADETISSHAYRWHRDNIRSWPMKLVDFLFSWRESMHCFMSYRNERLGEHLPPELRPRNWRSRRKNTRNSA